MKNVIPFLLLIGIAFTGCKKEEDVTQPKVIPEASIVNSFIWTNMHDYYLWNADIPGLSDPKYDKADSLNAFLNTYSDPEELFNSLLYQPGKVDKWSLIVDDSKELENELAGISETAGYTIIPVRIGTTQDLFGLVLYVYKDSPAEKAGIKRGDIFIKVNDQQITESNYRTLLYNTINSKLSYATIVNHKVTPIDRSVNITAVEMQENPINKDTVFTFNNQKIGYLVYNMFSPDFDLQLNDVMKKFKDANIDQLVLDLRYNLGGSGQSCIYLASMIYGTDESKLFAKYFYNAGVQKSLVDEYGSDVLSDHFVSSIAPSGPYMGASINTLNMKKIYIIVSGNTASASELLINGLRPYMDVKLVGVNTYGKFVGSITLKDEEHPSNKWAMQLIAVKYANSLGVSDFGDGLTPDIVAEEDIASLLPFGYPNETLLKAVLNDIQGLPVASVALKSAKMGLKKVADLHDLKRFGGEMYFNPEKLNGLKK